MQRCPEDLSLSLLNVSSLSFQLLAMPTISNPKPTIRHFTVDSQVWSMQDFSMSDSFMFLSQWLEAPGFSESPVNSDRCTCADDASGRLGNYFYPDPHNSLFHTFTGPALLCTFVLHLIPLESPLITKNILSGSVSINKTWNDTIFSSFLPFKLLMCPSIW